MQRYDFIHRLIQQIAEAIAKVAGLRSEGRTEEALAVIDQTYAALGVDPEALRRLDSRSLALLHGPPQKLRALARLCELQADLLDQLQSQDLGADRRRRALELLLEADAQDSAGADDELLRRLAARVDRATLGERYQARLSELG